MSITKEQLERLKADPNARFLCSIFGINFDKLMSDAEKEIVTPVKKEAKAEPEVVKTTDPLEEKIEKFFNKMVKDGRASVTIEDGHPHYSIKTADDYTEPESPETLVEENETTSFSMSVEELEDWINNYQKLEKTFRKLEYVFGIDFNANADSIYTQYNALVWTLIEKIFGSDNRDDIADFCFGNSNLDTVKDLYEELT